MIFSGCFSKKEIDLRPQKVLPSWYANPLETTSTTLYSTGEGEDREDAVANALSMMASTLSVSIASQFNSKKVVKEGLQNSIDSTVSNEVQSDVKKIRISHYEILNSQEAGFKKDATHREFMDFGKIRKIAEALGFRPVKEYSFPLPRFLGRFFYFNEFISVSEKSHPPSRE